MLTKATFSMISGTPANVMDYGAVGDGTTDDSAAITAALAASDTVYFPKPATAYRVASTIIVASNKTLTAAAGAKLLVDAGVNALWVQGSQVEINGLTIEYNTTPGDFTQTGSVGILVRNINSFGSPASAWVYVSQIALNNVNIYKAYTSIKIEAAFWVSLSNVHTYWDYFGFTLNKDQETVNGGASVPLPATTLNMDRAYFHGSQSTYATPAGSSSLYVVGVQDMLLSQCVTEYTGKAADFAAISAGHIADHYLENCEAGIEIYGALSPLLVTNPFILKGVGALPYCFRSGAGNITFYGGQVTMDGGPDVFYSPNPDLTGSCTFIKQPNLTDALLQVNAEFEGGVDENNSLVVNQSLFQSIRYTGWVSATPKNVTKTITSGGMAFVTGYSLTGDYRAVVTFNTSGVVTNIAETNGTGGTVTYAMASDKLQITSTGTAAQIFQELWVTAFCT